MNHLREWFDLILWAAVVGVPGGALLYVYLAR